MTGPRFIKVTPMAGGRHLLAVDRIVHVDTADHPGAVIWYRDNEMYSDIPSRIEVLQSVNDLHALIEGYPIHSMGSVDDEA